MKKKNQYHSKELMNLLNKYKSKGVSYLDALVELHLTLNIEFEEFIEMLPDSVIRQIKNEFKERKYHIKDSDCSENETQSENNILKFLTLKK